MDGKESADTRIFRVHLSVTHPVDAARHNSTSFVGKNGDAANVFEHGGVKGADIVGCHC